MAAPKASRALRLKRCFVCIRLQMGTEVLGKTDFQEAERGRPGNICRLSRKGVQVYTGRMLGSNSAYRLVSNELRVKNSRW
jgi:hypothetical protein